MGAGAWQLDMNTVLAPEYAHAITSFRFTKKVPLLGRFEDAAAMCLFYFLLMRVRPRVCVVARHVLVRVPQSCTHTLAACTRPRASTRGGRERQKRDSSLGCVSRVRMEGRTLCVESKEEPHFPTLGVLSSALRCRCCKAG